MWLHPSDDKQEGSVARLNLGEAATGNVDKGFQSLRKAKVDKAVHDACLPPCLAQIGGAAGEKPVESEMIKGWAGNGTVVKRSRGMLCCRSEVAFGWKQYSVFSSRFGSVTGVWIHLHTYKQYLSRGFIETGTDQLWSLNEANRCLNPPRLQFSKYISVGQQSGSTRAGSQFFI